MILPERVFGSPGAHWITSGFAKGPISWRTRFTRAVSSVERASGFVRVDHEGHVGVDRLALYIVVEAHHGSLRDGGVEHECTLYLCGANAMAGDVDHVIHAPRNPVISILVPASAVAGEIDPG